MSDSPTPLFEFEVWGDPVTQGSHQIIPLMRNGLGPRGKVPVLDALGRPKFVLQEDKGRRERLERWRVEIGMAAMVAMNDLDLLLGPVAIECVFYETRPGYHYGTGRNAGVLKDSAPAFPIKQTGDIDKLCRAVLDALKGKVWKDDSQVVDLLARRRFGDRAGVRIRLWDMGASMNDVIALGDENVLQLSLI